MMATMPLSQISRRDAFRAGLAGVASVGLGAACSGGKPSVEANGQVMPREAIESEAYGLSLGRFAPHVGSVFHFARAGELAVELTLTRATDLGLVGRPLIDRGECFSLSFAAKGAVPVGGLTQDTYAVSHAELGSFSIFVVPDAPSGARNCSALFNRV
jgi:hypothetical protein